MSDGTSRLYFSLLRSTKIDPEPFKLFLEWGFFATNDVSTIRCTAIEAGHAQNATLPFPPAKTILWLINTVKKNTPLSFIPLFPRANSSAPTNYKSVSHRRYAGEYILVNLRCRFD